MVKENIVLSFTKGFKDKTIKELRNKGFSISRLTENLLKIKNEEVKK